MKIFILNAVILCVSTARLRHVCQREGYPACEVMEEHQNYEERCYKQATWASVAYKGQESKSKVGSELKIMFRALRRYLNQIKEKLKNPVMIRFPTQESEVQRKTMSQFLANGNNVFESPNDNSILVKTLQRRCFYVFKNGGDLLKQHSDLHHLLEESKKLHSHDSYYVNTYTYRRNGRKVNYQEVMIAKIEKENKEKKE